MNYSNPKSEVKSRTVSPPSLQAWGNRTLSPQAWGFGGRSYFTTQSGLLYVSKRLIGVLFLTVVLFLSPNFFQVEPAKAEVQKPAAVVDRLSDRVAQAVVTDLSQQTGIAKEKLKITQYSRQTWSNGCLGIAKPEEICTQALVEGWRVVVAANNRTWVYRSDRNGRIVRLEPAKK